MITQFIIHNFLALLNTIVGAMPTLPDVPSSVTSLTSTIATYLGAPIAVLQMVYGSTLFIAIITMIVALLTFEQIYRTTMWILKKIPFVDIK